ncbi:hypothetical protein Aduo_011320 [Ancylostoma duodenale]
MVQCFFLSLLSVIACNGYKFLVYSPIFAYSPMNFMGAIADALTEAGHNVTVLMPVIETEYQDKIVVKLTKDIIKMLRNMSKLFSCQCERVITDKAVMKRLEEEKFDVGFAEALSVCGLEIFDVLKLPSSIVTFSGVHMSLLATAIGEPLIPSYVPGGMSTVGDRMNFFDRFKNALDEMFEPMFFGNIFNSEINVFRKHFGQNFKDYEQLFAEAAYVMTNSNPYLDFPRPMLHKTVPIGGVSVSNDSKRNKLSPEWDAVLNERNTTVLVSFGSLAKAMYMPEEFKVSLLEVFESMPDTTFIMKYEEEGSKMADHLPNVHLSTWFPQNALLADPRLTAFVTHGGLGSVTELAFQGKPAVIIPVIADQLRNAPMLAKHGGGIVLDKSDLHSPEKLRDSLQKILNDDSYAKNAKRLSKMLLNQPISAKQLLIRHSEFAARFGRLPNLDPYGRQLSFMQYYLLDILLVTVTVFAVVVYLIIRLFRKLLSLSVKAKRD